MCTSIEQRASFYLRPDIVLWSRNWLSIDKHTNTHIYMLASEWIAKIWKALGVVLFRLPDEHEQHGVSPSNTNQSDDISQINMGNETGPVRWSREMDRWRVWGGQEPREDTSQVTMVRVMTSLRWALPWAEGWRLSVECNQRECIKIFPLNVSRENALRSFHWM